MNNTYNRILDLVVNERLEEAMILRKRIAAGLIAAGAAVGLGTQMSKIGGSTPPPATLTRSIGGQATEKVPTNTTLAQPKSRTSVKPKARISVKPEDTGPESKRPKKRAESREEYLNRMDTGRTPLTPEEADREDREEYEKSLESDRQWRIRQKGSSHYGLPGLPKDALGRAKETPEDRQKRLHREGKVPNSYLPPDNK
tara:strand:- start:290 stop:886 length:597 start_codon:yes stop_codon:yes gene_type:complete